MKLVHTADWQIGRRCNFAIEGEGHDPNPALWQARLDAITRIAALACDEHADVVLVAGDVFDAQGLSDNTLRRTLHAMKDFGGRWILLPGNHDAAIGQSVWTRLQRLEIVPDNVTCALTRQAIDLPELRLSVLTAPLTQRQTHEDLTEAFDAMPTPEGHVRVGLAHGSVGGILPASVDANNPIASDRARRARLDYLALGDWHGTLEIDPRTWYSGTPEPDRFKANDAGNVLVVQIDAPGTEPKVRVVPTRTYCWRQQEHALRVAADVDIVAAELAGATNTDVLRLEVNGMVDVSTRERLRRVLDEAGARAHVLESDLTKLRLEPSAADLAGLQVDGALVGLVGELQAMQSGTDEKFAAVGNEALKLLFDALPASVREGAR